MNHLSCTPTSNAVHRQTDGSVYCRAVEASEYSTEDLLEEVRTLREALTTSRAIGTALGLIMANGGRTSSEAFDILRRESQHTNVRLSQLAVAAVEAHEAGLRPMQKKSHSGSSSRTDVTGPESGPPAMT